VEERGGRFTLDVPARARITGDRQLIAQALVNLLDNALKYGRHPERDLEITVSVRAAKDAVELAVADNGPGVPADMREKVKERFVRMDKARSKPGSGLGLSLVASIARLHGGELRLEDNAPGLRAVLVLPVRQDGGGNGARAA
jgi:signal transduction histidine kinase